MATKVILDAAYPPSPSQWVADMNAVGASGGLVYVWGPILNYSVAHVAAARNAGKIVIPVVVPGNDGPAWQNVMSRLNLFGFIAGPVLYDFELNSEPTNAWWQAQAASVRASGFLADRYGTSGELGRYTPEDEDWIASWLRSGVLQPIPSLQPGRVAWQFVNDVSINGSQYDVSVMDDAFMEGIDNLAQVTLDPHDAFVQEMRERINDIENILANGKRQGTSFDANGTPTYVDEPDWPNALNAAFAAISKPNVDASQVAAQLAANTAFIQAIATAVAHELGGALDKAQ